ncbi:hypothetical protein Avbf_18259 [Armadillidium vulgare]|nr:hypothetical protein Avbf_18259 [Armadillidium vulgare]
MLITTQDLKEIPVIREAPVGNNLQDHIATGGIVFLIDQPISMVQPRFENFWAVVSYTFFGKGPLTVLGGLEGVGFVDTIHAEEPEWPDIEFHLLTGTFASDGGRQLRKTIGFTERSWRAVYLPIAFRDAINIFPKLLRPASRGTIRLRQETLLLNLSSILTI